MISCTFSCSKYEKLKWQYGCGGGNGCYGGVCGASGGGGKVSVVA